MGVYFRTLLFCVMICSMTGCQLASRRQMEPIIVYVPEKKDIAFLPSAFSPLTQEEQQQEWGKQLILGDAFAKNLDLYRAITCYKSALVFLPQTLEGRRQQAEYNIILSYYLGLKYCDVIDAFESSSLINVNGSQFPSFDNLLMILYDSYLHAKQDEKAAAILTIIERCSPETADDLTLGELIKHAEFCQLDNKICSEDRKSIREALCIYQALAKSPEKARTLNAFLPGAGYWYIGQKKSALTSFLINALFIVASYELFSHGYPAAGVITSSLELGWYVGGINGAGIEAVEYNTRIYEGIMKKTMVENKLFPIFTFQTAF